MIGFRSKLTPEDAGVVEQLTRSSGFFSAEEVSIAKSLVMEALSEGDASGYLFVLAEQQSEVIGFACFGPIPATESSFDLYWIVVSKEKRRAGVGQQILAEVERRVSALAGQRLFVDTAGRPKYLPTQMFYLRSGYEQVAFLEGFYAPGDGKIIFAKRLNSTH